MLDYYRINVAKNGGYVFATEQGHLCREDEAKEVFKLLKEKFPEDEGYHVTVSHWVSTGHPLSW